MKVVGVLALAALVIGIIQIVRMTYRTFVKNEPMESGGSYGRQLFRRKRDD